MPNRAKVAVTICGFIAAVAGSARAEVKVKTHEFVGVPDPPPATKADQLTEMGVLRVVVGSGAGLRPEDFQVKVEDDDAPIAIKATKSVPFRDSADELAVVLLVQGNVRFLGNAEPDADGAPGYHDVVKQAIDIIARARPDHTRMGLYVYGNEVLEKAPMGPAANISGELLGAQADYAGIGTMALQRGIERALTLLREEKGRRVLFIIGEGAADNAAYNPLRDDLDKLERASIEVYALGASPRPPIPPEVRRLEQLGRAGAFRYATQREQVPQVAEFLANEMNGVYTVDFPVLARDGQMLPIDGKPHDILIQAGKEESVAQSIKYGPVGCFPGSVVACVCQGLPRRIGPPCGPPPNDGIPWWVWVLAGIAATSVAIVVYVFHNKRMEPDDAEPQTEPAPPPPPPPPLEPVVDRKTVIIGPVEDDNTMPLVSWIVPVNGPAAFQTFRLARKTTIGAASDCDVRIPDPYMSGHHAEIVLSAGTYYLMDAGARNGVVFCDKKVHNHPLIDNDQFTCGSTAFKYKTTGD